MEEMGLGELLKLTLRRVDRYLCLWLMRNFNPERGRLNIGDGHSVEIVANDVGWVMGISRPNTLVPTDISREWFTLLKKKYDNNNGIDEKSTFETIISRTLSEMDIKQTFLLYVLGVLLCPTQSSKISPAHLRVLHTAVEAHKYNWCLYVFDWLLSCARKFKRSKSKGGGYRGCAVFLMIFYLDRINIGRPVNWSVTGSRVDAWNERMCLDVIKKDRKNSTEFGNAEFVDSVMYGEQYPIGPSRKRWEDIRSTKSCPFSRRKVVSEEENYNLDN